MISILEYISTDINKDIEKLDLKDTSLSHLIGGARSKVVPIYYPIENRRGFKILHDDKSIYKLKKINRNPKMYVGIVFDSGFLNTDLTYESIMKTLNTYDYIPCFYFSSNVMIVQGEKEMQNIGPLVYVKWELEPSVIVYEEDISKPKLDVREQIGQTKKSVVARFVRGQYFLLCPIKEKYIENPEISIINLDSDKLQSIEDFAKNKKKTQQKYNISKYHMFVWKHIKPELMI